MEDEIDKDGAFPLFDGREAKIAGAAFAVGIFLARTFYRHRYIAIKLVNAQLEDMFTKGNIKSADGDAVMLQFFHN